MMSKELEQPMSTAAQQSKVATAKDGTAKWVHMAQRQQDVNVLFHFRL